MSQDDIFSAIWTATWVLSCASIICLLVLYVRRLIIEAADRRRDHRRKLLSDQVFKFLDSPSDSTLLGPLKKHSDQRILLSVASRLLQNVSGETRDRLIGLLNDTIDFEWLLKTLGTGAPSDRAKVAARLFWADDARVHAALQKALDDREPEVVLAAAGSLIASGQNIDLRRLAAIFAERGMLSNRAAREVFRDLAPANVENLTDLLSHSNPDVVVLAADALSRAQGPDVAAVLAAIATTHHSKDVRAQAVRSIGLCRHDGGADAVLMCLDDESWEVRSQAAVAAERLKLVDAVPRLVAMIRDANWWVQMRAAEALAQLGERGTASLEALRGDPDVGMLAEVALAERHAA